MFPRSVRLTNFQRCYHRPLFAGVSQGAPALAFEARLDPVTIPSTYIGTRSGP